MAEGTQSDGINQQSKEYDSHLENSQAREHQTSMQSVSIDEFDPFSKKSMLQISETNDSSFPDFTFVEKSEPILGQPTSNQSHHNRNEATSQSSIQYNKSISMPLGNDQAKSSNMQRNRSMVEDAQNDEQNNERPVFSAAEQSEKRNEYSSVSRLLEPTCEGIRERIELLGELLISKKLDVIPDVYDEMAQIVAATERNERFRAGPDGTRLLELTTAARSNLNIDLHNLDAEIQRQFGLYSVEVTGDGACAFRAILISGLQQPDFFHSEMRDKAIQQVLDNASYYSTVLRPGDKVDRKELENWAQAMYDPNTYGDELANIAVTDRYHIQLVIFRAGELLTVVNPRDGLVERTAFLVNVGTHYKSLVPKHELEQARQHSERLCK